jgi:hypothetical protein
MFTEDQILYLEEVLGTSVESYRTLGRPPQPEVAVVTPPLSPDETALLTKILNSVNLTAFVHVADQASIAQETLHILEFNGGNGRRNLGERTCWDLPSIASMAGAGPEVTEAKKQTWSLLQQFQKERRK